MLFVAMLFKLYVGRKKRHCVPYGEQFALLLLLYLIQ